MSILDSVKYITANITTRKVYSESIKFYNTDKNTSYIYVKFKVQDDDNSMCYLGYDEIKDFKVELTVAKPKKKQLVIADGVIQPNKNIFSFELPSNFTDQVGEYIGELKVSKDEDEITFDYFIYNIKNSVVTGLNPEIETDPDLPILKQLIDEVKALQENGGSSSGGSNVVVIDNLTSSDGNKALSANQGKALKALIDNQTLSINSKADATNIPTKLSQLTNDKNFLESIPIASDTTLGGVKIGNGLSVVSGVLRTNDIYYSDIKNKPTMPTVTNDLTNELKAGYDGIKTEVENARGNDSNLDTRLDNIDTQINTISDKINALNAQVNYVAPSITSFTSSPAQGTFEIGSSIKAPIKFNWTINKDIQTQSLTNINNLNVTDRTATISSGTYTTDKSFTLTVSDGQKSASKTLNFYFRHYRYWGANVKPDDYDSSFILGLTNKEFASSKSKSNFSVTAGEEQYIYYCIPTSWGDPTFNVGGFDGGFSKVKTIDFTNASGNVTSFDIWESDNANLGTQNITIK